MVAILGIMFVVAVGAASYVGSTNTSMRVGVRQVQDAQTLHLAEAGVQSITRTIWRNFKSTQAFTDMTTSCNGASESAPKLPTSGTIPTVGAFAASVISFTTPLNSGGQPDTYTRNVKIRAVGWLDRDNDSVLDSGEPRKIVDVAATFTLQRSQVFDYTYFVNNYGWMDGFHQNDLIINGDMRANGNFSFLNGLPTVNGSVYACNNEKLSPAAAGILNTMPVKWTNSTYSTAAASDQRMRQVYNSGVHGAQGTSQFEQWRDFVFNSDGTIVGNKTFGTIAGDASGLKTWQRTSESGALTQSQIDTRPTEEVVMPDLSDLSRYSGISSSYVDTRATLSGLPNPDYGVGAYVEVWNSSTSSYQRLSTNGVVTGSAALVGTSSKPIKVHGPVTFTQDCVIKGYVQGQGTIYTGRNVHIVGSIRYVQPPDFRGGSPSAIDTANESKTMLGLAARASVIMGNTAAFTSSYPLQYMKPPFTKGRYDDNGNWIPPFDATQVDSTGKMKYQSTFGDSYVNSIAESVNVIDAVLYTNFVGGGNIGTSGSGVAFNGSIISKDEAMVVYSLPMKWNYDNRIRERSSNQTPLIDLQLPRSPAMFRSTWQDRGFYTY